MECVRCVVWVYCDLLGFTGNHMEPGTRNGHCSREVLWE
jgi:hypothetical protein